MRLSQTGDSTTCKVLANMIPESYKDRRPWAKIKADDMLFLVYRNLDDSAALLVLEFKAGDVCLLLDHWKCVSPFKAMRIVSNRLKERRRRYAQI